MTAGQFLALVLFAAVFVVCLWVWAFVKGRPQRAAWRAAPKPQPPPQTRQRPVPPGSSPGRELDRQFSQAIVRASETYLEFASRLPPEEYR